MDVSLSHCYRVGPNNSIGVVEPYHIIPATTKATNKTTTILQERICSLYIEKSQQQYCKKGYVHYTSKKVIQTCLCNEVILIFFFSFNKIFFCRSKASSN